MAEPGLKGWFSGYKFQLSKNDKTPPQEVLTCVTSFVTSPASWAGSSETVEDPVMDVNPSSIAYQPCDLKLIS